MRTSDGNNENGRRGSIAAVTMTMAMTMTMTMTMKTTMTMTLAVVVVCGCAALEGLGFGGPPPAVFVAALPLSPSSPPHLRHLLLHRRTAAMATRGRRRRRRVVVDAATRLAYKNVPDGGVGVGGGGDDDDECRSSNYHRDDDDPLFAALERRDAATGDEFGLVVDDDDEGDDASLRSELRNQRDAMIENRRGAMVIAMRNASRRTNPADAIAARIEEGRRERDGRERAGLERAYVERRERLDADDEEEEERRRRAGEEDGERGERGEDGVRSIHSEVVLATSGGKGKDKRRIRRMSGIPVLDVLSRPPVFEAPPLLVGGTLTLPYADLTPCQRKALRVAITNHHAMSSSSDEEEQAGEDDGRAKPIIAVIDGYTARAAGPTLPRGNPRGGRRGRRRYATLASVEIIEDYYGGGGGSSSSSSSSYWRAVRLEGVGRAFLADHHYFLSSDGSSVRMSKEEEELSDILARIREFDDECGDYEKEEEEENDDGGGAEDLGLNDDDHDDEGLPVIMAEFDVFLDDPTVLLADDLQYSKYGHRDDGTSGIGGAAGASSSSSSSSVHAIAELYRAANKAYRLHEERRRLVAGLRAGAARLRLSREKRRRSYHYYAEDEFHDFDGLGQLVGGWALEGEGDVVAWTTNDNNTEEWMTPPDALWTDVGEDDVPIGRELESMENYGLGTYGILSTIPDLARQLMSHLEPYYSPAHREREEYEAEVASMAVLRTLEEYATPAELAAGLLAPCATRRLEIGFEVMMNHKGKLKELVRIISEELLDCGEECTDLW